MKRVIKFYNVYSNDGFKFSDCSTKYEILPIVVADSAGKTELMKVLKQLELTAGTYHKAEKPTYGYRSLSITHCIEVGTKEIKQYGNESISVPYYLGFITIPKGSLEILESIDNEITEKQLSEIINNQDYGISDIGEMIDGGTVVVKSGWNYYHGLPLSGYSLKKFETLAGITEHGFDDDTEHCYSCNKYDSRDNGYTYNFREFKGDYLGVNCGCYDSACENEYNEFFNDSEKAMELKTAESLAEKGKLEHVERYIGGMVDGRGGYYAGESVPEGNPADILTELLKENPEGKYIFTHDESGQFQTYFSVWQVID